MMRTNREQLSKYTLIYPTEKLEIVVREGENSQGSLTFVVEPAHSVSGLFHSTHTRMRCVESEFEGEKITLSYFFDSTGLTDGDEVNGKFYLVTEIGEFSLPFYVTVKNAMLQSSIGEIKGLFHFVNLARMHFDEATELFFDPYFSSIFESNDQAYLEVYRGLAGGQNKKRCVEEFLIKTGKKYPITLSIISQSLEIHGVIEERYSFKLTREGWGYTHIRVKSNQPFVSLLREEYTDDDFAGNQLEIGFVIKPERISALHQEATIEVAYGDETINYLIRVNRTRTGGISAIKRHDYYKMLAQMEQLYVQRRTGTLSRSRFEEAAEQVINQLSNLDNNALIPKMFQTILLFCKGHANESKWILRHIDEEMEREDITPDRRNLSGSDRNLVIMRTYMGYLLSENEGEREACIEDMRRLTEMYPRQVFSLHALGQMHVFSEQETGAFYQALKKAHQLGVKSPLLYYDVLSIYQKETKYMQELDDFCMQTMCFARKHGLLEGAVYARYMELCTQEKSFSKLLARELLLVYHEKQDDEALQAVCTMLIKARRTDETAYRYYALAVERELRITSLYEYYMMSRDLDDDSLVPRIILLYFSYRCDLDYVHTAYLYHMIVQHREEIPDIYSTYEQSIREFSRKQLLQSHVSDDLAYLYEFYLEEFVADKSLVIHMADVLFSHKITVHVPNMKYIVLIEQKVASERKVPISDKHAYVNIFDNEYAVLLEDEQGNRFLGDNRISIRKLFHKTKVAELIDRHLDNYPGFALFFVRTHEEMNRVSSAQMDYFLDVYRDEQFVRSYRQHIGCQMMQHYYDNNMFSALDSFLDIVDQEGMTAAQRAQYIKYLILREKDAKAAYLIRKYGFEKVSVRCLNAIFTYLMKNQRDDMTDLLAIANYILKSGKADDTVVTFLVDEYEGSVKSMQTIWKEAKIRNLPSVKIAAKIIVQSLYSGAYVTNRQEIFLDYYAQEHNPDIVREYLQNNAHQYFSKGQVIDRSIFAVMLEQKKLPLICKIAAVYFLAEQQGQISLQEQKHLQSYLNELVHMGYYFPFFQKFANMIPGIIPRGDKTYVEYHTAPGTKVQIHYMIGDFLSDTQSYQVKEMKELYDGYYCEGFDLFETQQLSYYISEGEEENVVESKIVSGAEREEAALGRLKMINQILQCKDLSEDATLREASYEYVRQSFMTKQIFEIR